MSQKIYSMMGLAQKAGQLISGNDLCEKAIKSKKCLLVIIAKDASEKTKKRFYDICKFRQIKLLEYGQKDEIGSFIGKSERSVIAFKNVNFADKIEELIRNINNEENGGVPIA